MNVWRLIAHHEYPKEVAEWIRRDGVIAIGWGGMGDLRQQTIHDEAEAKRLVDETHPGITNHANGGRALWRLYKEMQKGDLVIISAAGSRTATMRVTGDYYFVDNEYPIYYEHRRKAEVVPIDSNQLWQTVGKVAPGEGVYGTLVRCTRSISETEFEALVDRDALPPQPAEKSQTKPERSYVPQTALAGSVACSSEAMYVFLTDGRVLSVPLRWFPRLWAATPEQRANVEIGGGGISLHWPDIDEDLSVANLMAGPDWRSA